MMMMMLRGERVRKTKRESWAGEKLAKGGKWKRRREACLSRDTRMGFNWLVGEGAKGHCRS